jgi:hypothetical protein
VQAPELQDAARSSAAEMARLDMGAHVATKLRTRDLALKAIHAAIGADDSAIRAAGMASQ